MAVDPYTATRRKLLTASGSLAALSLAGCLGDDDDDDVDEESSGDDVHHDDHGDDDDHDHGDDDHYDHDNGVEDEEFDHIGIAEFDVLDRAHDPHEQAAYVHGDHWHGSLPSVPLGDNVSLGAEIEDDDGDEFELDGEYELRVALAPDEPEGVLEFDSHGDHVHIIGEGVGVADVVFQIWHDDHADFQTPPITAQVTDDADDDHDHDDHDEYVSEFQLLDRAHDPHEEISSVDGDHWHGEDDFPTIPAGDNVSIGAYVEDADGEEIALGPEYELGVRVADDAEDGIVAIDEDEDFHGDHVHIYGEAEGETEVVFELWHDDHVDYETPPITVQIGDSD